MLLAIDIGNTQTVVGLFEAAQLRHTWRFASDVTRTTDELKAIVTQLFHEADSAGKDSTPPLKVTQVIIASVVPALTRIWTDLAQGLSYCTVASGQPIIVNADTARRYSDSSYINNPAEVGADRIANTVAAKALYGAPAIVLDFGTATNIDAVSKDGTYIGGIISPGIQTAANALFKSAARLPAIDLDVPPKVLGTTTKTAVQSGLLHGEAGKVDALICALQKELPTFDIPNLPVIATGGLAALIAPLIPRITHSDEHLTLKGLQLIAQEFDHG